MTVIECIIVAIEKNMAKKFIEVELKKADESYPLPPNNDDIYVFV